MPMPVLMPYVAGGLPSDADLAKLREGMTLEQVAELFGTSPYRLRKGDRVVWVYATLHVDAEEEPATVTTNALEITFVDGKLVEWPGHPARR